MSDQSPSYWDQYCQLVDLFRFYLDLIIKVNLFFAAIVGGIVGYVASGGTPLLLALPLLISLFFLVQSAIGFFQSRELHQSVKVLAKAMDLKQQVHSSLLVLAALVSIGLHTLISGTLVVMILWPDLLIVPEAPATAK